MSESRTTAWRSHRGSAAAVRLVAVALPAALSAGVAITLGVALPAPPTLPWALGRLGTILVASTLVVLAVRIVTRRLLPLSALLSLSLAFPDETPRRLRVALRAPSARQLQADLANGGLARLGRGRNRTEAIAQIVGLVTAISTHHRLTRGHSERVRAYADLIAAELGVGSREREMVRWAALLHDLGKLTVPTSILDKPGRPDQHEWSVLAGHPAASAKLAEPLRSWMGDWWNGIGQHHERWDGTGYPDHLAGEHISLSARIVALADSFETMTASRSYKRPVSIPKAREEIVRCAGTHFDPQVVRAFLNVGLGRLRRVAGLASWLPVPLVNLVIPLRNAATSAAGNATSALAAGAVAVAVVTATAPAASAAAPASTSATTVVTWSSWLDGLGRLASGPGPSDPAGPEPASGGSVAPAANAGGPPTGAGGQVAAGSRPTGPATPGVGTASPAVPPAPSTAPDPGTTPTTAPAAGTPTTATRATTTTAAAATTTTTTPPPVLQNDDVDVALGATATIDVLANDRGVVRSSLAVTNVQAGLTATVTADGNIRVTVGADVSSQTRNVTYRACNAAGACATAKLHVRTD